jgi:ribosome biogenesis protein ERB1
MNSAIALHPYGDNILVGGTDFTVSWFDLDLQDTPFKVLKYHEKVIR